MICDEAGLPLDFLITAGEKSDYTYALPLLQKYPQTNVIADRGYDSDEIVNFITAQGNEAVIPARKNRIYGRKHDSIAYKLRNKIERLFGRLKQFRKLAVRFEKYLRNYASLVYLACSYVWLDQM